MAEGQQQRQHLPDAAGPADTTVVSQTGRAQGALSPREILWCYQLRQENIALTRRLDCLEQETQCLKSQQTAPATIEEMGRQMETFLIRMTRLEQRVDGHESGLTSVKALVAEKPGHEAIDHCVQQATSAMRTLQDELSISVRETEDRLQHRLNDAESVLELLVKCAEASRGLTSEFRDNLKRMGSTTLEMRRELDILGRKHECEFNPMPRVIGVIWQRITENLESGTTLPGASLVSGDPGHTTGHNHEAGRSTRCRKRIIKKTTIMDSQSMGTPTDTHRAASPRQESVLPSIEKDESEASPEASIGREQSSASRLSSSSPEIEEHHQFGGSLEIDKMPPPPELEETQSYVSTPAPGQQRACTTISAPTPMPVPIVVDGQNSLCEANIQQGSLSLEEYLRRCQRVLQERYPRRRDEARAVEMFWEGLANDGDSDGALTKAKIEETLEERGWLWKVFAEAIEEVVQGKVVQGDTQTMVTVADSMQACGKDINAENGDVVRTLKPAGKVEMEEVAPPPMAARWARDHASATPTIIAQTPEIRQGEQATASRVTRRASRQTKIESSARAKAMPCGKKPGKAANQPEIKQETRKRRRREIPIVWDDEDIGLCTNPSSKVR